MRSIARASGRTVGPVRSSPRGSGSAVQCRNAIRGSRADSGPATIGCSDSAETVATILTERFGIAAENLTTQGYGEQYLKIDTQEAERENRRVTVRNITPLLRRQAAQ